MSALSCGSVCTGAGGLDMAVAAHFGASLTWAADTDNAARRVIAHRLGVPDLGDIRTAGWAGLPPVDVLCGGFPCQPVSQAGQQKGSADERWLWPDVLAVVRSLDPPPRLLVFENVPRLLSVDGGRLMAAVVCGLAAVGYVGRYGLFRASDVGAPHQRKRLFITAWRAAADPGDRPVAERARGPRGSAGQRPPVGGLAALGAAADPAGARRRDPEDPRAGGGAPGPAATPGGRRAAGGGEPERAGDGAAADPRRGGRPPWQPGYLTAAGGPPRRARPPADSSRSGSGADAAAGARAALSQLLPTPCAGMADGGMTSRSGSRRGELLIGGLARELGAGWGTYGPAIRRWEAVTGVPAPCPAEVGGNGNWSLAPAFAEWMMGWPPGWVTGVPGLTRADQLRLIGNGVVPAQGRLALEVLDPPW